MNKKLLIVVVVLLLLAGGWYYMSSIKSVSPLTQSPNSTEQKSENVSLKGLISKGIPQTCTFIDKESKGTVYVDGGKVREDFETTVDDKVMKSHVIVMDNAIYNWTDGEKNGIKMTFDPKATPVAVAAESPSAGSSGNFNADTSMNYKCGVWLPDSGKFALPSDVAFSSFDTSTSQCSYCNALSGDDKTQCLTALKCK